MGEANRRRFLAVAGGGAAVGAAGVVGLASPAGAAARLNGAAAQEAVVAWVPSHESSELVLMVGEREVVVHDRDLVTRILNAAGAKA